jgi:HAE1 family hydrophobic/amphiphilic exporter-1
VRRKLREIAPKIPGVRLEVQDSGRFWERNAGKRIGFRLSGPDTEVLTELALEAKRRLEQLEGLLDFYTTAEGGRFELQTRVDRDLAREYRVGVAQAADVVDYTFRGRQLARYRGREAVEEVEMSLTLDEQERESIEQLKSLPLVQGGSRERRSIPLATVADFAVVRGPEDIQRDDRVTGVWVGARFEEGTEEEHVARCKAALDEIPLPYGYRWDHQQFMRPEEESQAEFLTTLLLALGLIFAVMASLFESVRQALSLMVSLPFAVAGAAWTLYLTGTDFDQPASVGLLLLLGIVVNNGIVMIAHINDYRRRGLPREEAMVRGGRERLRPVIMTALTTLLGLLPMAVQRPSLAGVYYYSMALVIMGGLLISTILTTLLLPTTVCLTEDALGAVARLGRWSARSVRGAVLRAPARAG